MKSDRNYDKTIRGEFSNSPPPPPPSSAVTITPLSYGEIRMSNRAAGASRT